MGSWLLERRLSKVGSRLKALRLELSIVNEQLLYLNEDAEDLALRQLVAETPGSSYEARTAQGSFEAMSKHQARVVAEIAELEQRQDELLDQMAR